MIRSRKKNKYAGLILFLIVLFLFLFTPILRITANYADRTLASMAESISYFQSLKKYFYSVQFLAEENRHLRLQVANQSARSIDDHDGDDYIILRPGLAGLDNVVVRFAGSADDISVGDMILHNSILLAYVSEIRKHTLTAKLLSANGSNTAARIKVATRADPIQEPVGETESTQEYKLFDIELVGRGSMDMQAIIPRDAVPSLELGDLVFSSEYPGLLIGIVRYVIFDERSATKTILISLPVDLMDIEDISIRHH